MTVTDNPREVVGGNNPPDTAKIVTNQLAESYVKLSTSITELLNEARSLPHAVEDDATMGILSAMVKRMQDTNKIVETHRVKEKEPYLRGGRATDSFFDAIKDRVSKGAAILHARVDAYNQRKLADERRRRDEEAREAARIAQQAREEREKRERDAREAEEASRRARKPENVAAREEEARQANASAGVATVQSYLTDTAAQNAAVQAAKKPADMVRTRHDTGVLTTMAQVPYVEVVDRDKLDKNIIWAFLKDDAILAAVKAWAKTRNHKTTMDGAIIEMKDKTVIT